MVGGVGIDSDKQRCINQRVMISTDIVGKQVHRTDSPELLYVSKKWKFVEQCNAACELEPTLSGRRNS